MHGSRIHQLAEAGRLRHFAVFGVDQVPLSKVKDRIEAKANARLRAARSVPTPKHKPRRERDAWEVGAGAPVQTVESQV